VKRALVSIVIPYKILEEGLSIWMQKRLSSDELNGLLEFPGGKIEKKETPVIAAIREVKEETGVLLSESDLKLATIFENQQETSTISLYVFVCNGENLFEENWFQYDKREEFWSSIPPANQVFLGEVIADVISNS
jgi:mutator protein MutT